MATLTSINGNFKQRYGSWVDPLPDEQTLAEIGEFIPGENRPGLGYNFPVLTGISHGQTANVDGTAFALNSGIDTSVLNASLDGATIIVRENVSYDVIYKSLNGAGNGSQGGAFKNSLDVLVESMLQGGALYRELALGYGPGTSTAVAANIGVISTNVAGALSTARQCRISKATYIPGLWILMQGALIDIYQADGTTPREVSVTVQGVTDPNKTSIQIFKAASAVVPQALDVIVPLGWRTKSCFGLEAIYNNVGTLFGISAANGGPWRCPVVSAGAGILTRSKIMGWGARIALNGCKKGGKLLACTSSFADLAEEASALQRFTGNTDKKKNQGASSLSYDTACGVIEVINWQYAKQGQAMFISSDNFRRVGSTDLTMRPIGHGEEGFFSQLPDNAGAQMRVFSNQAPVFEIPYRNFLVTLIDSPNAILDAA